MSLTDLQQRLGYIFSDMGLLEQALRHPSAGEPSYQRLEFLGDRVLGLVVSAWLYEVYPDAAEGELSRRLTLMVRESTLAEVARTLGVHKAVQVGVGESGKESILADVVEALLGAMWLENGINPVASLVKRAWVPYLDLKDEKDAKTRLQEWLQQRKLPVPVYEVAEEHGPAHDRSFTINVVTEAGEATGQGRTKQLAGLEAAANLMKKLEP